MPEIGETLREARMRAKIDVSEVEAQTKIRAKYLRAIENEEWGLMPGPTFVRSFLRTYADYLGLDSKLLVEEFKLRHEHPSELDLAPIAPPNHLAAERRRLSPPRISRGWVLGVSVLGLLALLLVLGLVSGRDDEGGSAADSPASTTAPAARPARPAAPAPAPQPTRVRLSIIPSGDVYVCLEDERGQGLIPGVILEAGEPSRTFSARRFRVTLGNGAVDLRINGRRQSVPESSSAIGYEITPRGRRALPQGRLPTCQ